MKAVPEKAKMEVKEIKGMQPLRILDVWLS